MVESSKTAAHEARRAHIIGCACEVMVLYGIRKTTLEDISRRAGMRKSSVYYYFRSKEEILAHVVRSEGAAFNSGLESAIEGATGASEKLRAFSVYRYNNLLKLKVMFKITRETMLELLPHTAKAHEQVLLQETELVERVVREGVSTGEFSTPDPARAARAIIIGLKGLDSSILASNEEQHDALLEVANQFTEMVLTGLISRPSLDRADRFGKETVPGQQACRRTNPPRRT